MTVSIHADAGLVSGSTERCPPPAFWNDICLWMLTFAWETQLLHGPRYKAAAYTNLLFKEIIINNTYDS